MSIFLCCLTKKRKKSVENYSVSNEQLPRAKSMLKQPVPSSKIYASKFLNQKQLRQSKTSMRHSIVHSEGYAQITNLANGSNMYLTDDELNFRMDYDDGISHKLTINTFHYEVKNDEPGFLYYQNVGPKGFQQKQTDQVKRQQPKQKHSKREVVLDLQDKTDEIPTNF